MSRLVVYGAPFPDKPSRLTKLLEKLHAEREFRRKFRDWLKGQARVAEREEAMATGGVLASVLWEFDELERGLLGEETRTRLIAEHLEQAYKLVGAYPCWDEKKQLTPAAGIRAHIEQAYQFLTGRKLEDPDAT